MHRRPLLSLVLLGLLSEAIYLLFFTLPFFLPHHYTVLVDLGQLTEYKVSSAIAYVLAMVTLFGLCYLGWRLCLQGAPTQALFVILLFAGLFGVTLALMYPVTAIDMFNYFVQARVLNYYHQNPLIIPPSHFPQDPFL